MARPTLFSNRKFLKLAARLGSRALALGHLELLWHAANESGNPIIGDAGALELVAYWQGEQGELVAALMESGSNGGPGFVQLRADGRYEIHDYWHHAPEYAADRRGREDERQRPKACGECSREYFSADGRSEYCSAACRQSAYRKRKRDGRDGPLQTPPSRPPRPSRGPLSTSQSVTDGVTNIRHGSDSQASDSPGSVTDGDGPLRSVTDRYGTPAPAPAPTTPIEDPPTPRERGAGLLTQTSRRKPRAVRRSSDAAWAQIVAGSARTYDRQRIEADDPVLAEAVRMLGGWNRFGQSTAIGTLKAPFRETYEALLDREQHDQREVAAS